MTKNKFLISCTLCCVLFCTTAVFALAKGWSSTVAIVVDEVTYGKVKGDIDSYVKSMSTTSNMGSYARAGVLIIDKWGQPDSIKNALYKLYINNNLEGAVFIGDIPVPMIRDAHHLTTAFKMSPKRDWKDSSVPSDRFYDDFDLKFKYIKQDADVKLYHYYSLTADSPQSIQCDIYSGRIKPPMVPGKDKYVLISEYLKKAIAAKSSNKEMSKILHFAGHGYNSESMNARIDEAAALYEQFPFLRGKAGADLEYIDYTFDKFIKPRLQAALSDKELDLAILHHHGSEDAQLLNGSPYAADAASWIDMAKNFFRSKIRGAKDTSETTNYFVKNYDIPREWVADTFNPKTIEKDSIYSASMDINIPDMYGYLSGAKVILLDACFNGSFHLDDYISAYYIFNPGGTIAVKANSVNTLQDTWTNELLGVLNYGVCVGNWSKGQMTLESHIIGGAKGFSLNRDITKERGNVAYWRKLLLSDIPDVKCLAMKMLASNNAISSDELLNIERSDKSEVVRLEAFAIMKQRADNKLIDAILIGMNDSYELLQRLSTMTAAKSGNPKLIAKCVEIYLSPISTVRIDFQNKYLMDILDGEKLVEELKKQRADKGYNTISEWPNEKVFETKIKSIKNTFDSRTKEFNGLKEGATPLKEKNFTISGQRNSCNVYALDGLFYLLSPESSADETMKLSVAEALGWYRYSYMRDDIVKRCLELQNVEKSPLVKEELLKTINRLK